MIEKYSLDNCVKCKIWLSCWTWSCRDYGVYQTALLLLNTKGYINRYYDVPENRWLEHFTFCDIFLTNTKNAYISFVTPEMLLEIVTLSSGSSGGSSKILLDSIPLHNSINHTSNRRGYPAFSIFVVKYSDHVT